MQTLVFDGVEVTFVDNYALPVGWFHPSVELLRKVKLHLEYGLAAPSAPQLHTPHLIYPVDAADTGAEEEGRRLLLCVTKGPHLPFKPGMGMASPQLARHLMVPARRMFAAHINLEGLTQEHLTQEPQLFVNPVVELVESEGYNDDYEMCFSVPGVVVVRRRCNTVLLDGMRVVGSSARVVQHENDHLDAGLCVDEPADGMLYYVPPELYPIFARYYNENRLAEWPFIFSPEQLYAMKTGQWNFQSYFHLIA